MSRSLIESAQREGHAPRASAPRLVAAGLLALAIFIVDTFTQLGSAIAVLYVVVIIIMDDTSKRRRLWISAVGCFVLAVTSFVIVHGDDPKPDAVLRLVVSLSAIIATNTLMLRGYTDRMFVEAQARLLDISSDAIFVRDRNDKIVFWNQGAERLYGFSREEALGQDAHGLLRTKPGDPFDVIAAQLARSEFWEGELVQKSRDGEEIIVLSRWQLQRDRSGGASTTLESNTDITVRRKINEALRVSEERYRTIFNALAIGIWEHDLRPLEAMIAEMRGAGISDLRGFMAEHPEWVRRAKASVTITDVNETALRMFKAPSKEQFFRTLDDMLPEPDESFPRFIEAMADGQPRFESRATLRDTNGDEIEVIVAMRFPHQSFMDRIHASILDVTDRVRMQEALEETRSELEHAMRAATMGELSASIAHEVNQPLSAITTYADATRRWLQRDPPDIAEARHALDEVVGAARHAGEIIKRVRGLLSRAKPETIRLDVGRAVAESARFIEREIAAQQVTVSIDYGDKSVTVEADRILLQQVFINLMVNAIQAMEAVPPAERRLGVAVLHEKETVLVAIADSGPGFSTETAAKAFQPFFTTKARGMGLGLSMCRSIVEAHGGTITLACREPGEGAVVGIRLPVVD